MQNLDKTYAAYQKNIESVEHTNRPSDSLGKVFSSISTNTTVKSDYQRSDYNYFRSSGIPINRANVLKVCQEAYDKVGIVKNVIDLMSDYGSKGVKIKHPVPSVERFYQQWFSRVAGLERSERFLNSIFRLGSVVIYKSYGIIPSSQEEEFKKVTATIDSDGEFKLDEYKNRYIPIKYTYLNPSSVEVLGEEMGIAFGRNIYVLKLNESFLSVTNSYLLNKFNNEQVIKVLTQGLPKTLRSAILEKKQYYILEDDRLSVYNYRKDDWQSWGKPITFSILNDLQVLEKLKLADISALDGAISNIRLWTVGQIGDSPQTTFLPTPGMLEKVRNILANNVGGGTMDLVWGPDLSFKESATSVHEFLGEEKYKPTIDAIYDGMGIPSPLRSGSTSGQTNDYISLKTLIERLNYGRNLLTDFWNKEIKLVQKACGFSKPAVLEFDYMVFTDEAAEKQLLINLADRDIIAPETVMEKFNLNSGIEEAKLKRDNKKRGNKLPNKAGPYHVAQTDHEYNKILLQAGTVTPSEVGMELQPRKDGEQTRQDILFEQQKQIKDKEIQSKNQQAETPGRPPAIKETKKRNPKTGQKIKVSTNAETLLWAFSAQELIHKTLLPGLNHIFGKQNLRQLTESEFESFERLKCNLLFSFKPMEEISAEKIAEKMGDYKNYSFYDDAKVIAAETQVTLGRDLKIEEKRQIYSLLYVENQ